MRLRDTIKGTVAFFRLLREGRLHELDHLSDHGRILGEFQVTKFENAEAERLNDPYHIGEPFHNILVNLGMEEIWDLVTGQGGSAFSNANAALGVGDDALTPPAVGQTDLQALVNKKYNTMAGGYPLAPVLGVEVWRASFAGAEANYAWEEYGVFNSNAPGVMMNRSQSSQGTKIVNQVWLLSYTITLS